MRGLIVVFAVACSSAAPAPNAPQPAGGALALIEASPDLDGALVGAATARATVAVVFASWCSHCQRELDILARLRAEYPGARILGLNYRGHEEYDGRGSASAVRAYVAARAPWLRVVPAGEPLFAALGRPPKVPTIFIYDRAGALVVKYDRLDRPLPSAGELAALLRHLGA